ncbi:cytochrome c-type biogenesis protein [Zoogloea sp.]|uniref:cytochrome c-type biogenesis protein n=1 Tax=Zoogloea sp. TaxID=49181 RepID=UPI0035B341AE
MTRTLARLRAGLLTAALLAGAGASLAADATPMAEDPAVEARMVAISEELRCLVCQNESLAASRAELAEDLRREVRKLIRDGKSDPEIRDYLVARYGDFVLYRPPVKPTTWLLWFGPFALLAGALAGLIAYLRRRGARAAPATLSAADKAAAEALLADPAPDHRPKPKA